MPKRPPGTFCMDCTDRFKILNFKAFRWSSTWLIYPSHQQSLLSHTWPPPFTLGTYPAGGGTGICDPGLVTLVTSSPEATCLYLLLVLHFSSLYPGLLRRKMRKGEYRVLGIGAEMVHSVARKASLRR